MAALGSAARLLGTAERFYGFQLMGTVAVTLDDLGAGESARLVGAWLIDKRLRVPPPGGIQRARLRPGNAARGPANGRCGLGPEAGVATMTDADVVAMCREALED